MVLRCVRLEKMRKSEFKLNTYTIILYYNRCVTDVRARRITLYTLRGFPRCVCTNRPITLDRDYDSRTAAAGIREDKNKNAKLPAATSILWESKTIELLCNVAFNAAAV